ncbi:MAG: nitroreductase family protein [Dehalococcoidia bacterium]|nr:nitroreductase family protein [Dehalococcoidia bacterium]
MDVIEAMANRQSVRKFKSVPVPKEVLRDILDVAIQSPSAMNTQPWAITVVTGEALERLKKDNLSAFASGAEAKADLPHIPFQDEYRRRQVDLAIQIFKLMDIAREDKQKRQEWQQLGFRFFDAPVAILLSIDKSLTGSEMSLLDMGAIMYAICLAAMKHGLGTCIEDQGVMFPQAARKHAMIPDSRRLVIAIAVGYPDWDFPANKLESTREPLNKVVTWVE